MMLYSITRLMIHKNIDTLGADIADMSRQVQDCGYAVFNAGRISRDSFLNFCYNFGEVVPSGRGREMVDDICTDSSSGSAPLPLHTDKSYWRVPPRYEILYVESVTDMERGGIAISSLMYAFRSLTEHEQSKLLAHRSCYASPGNRDSGYNQSAHFVVSFDGIPEFFRYRLDIIEDRIPEIDRLSEELEKPGRVRLINYKIGDIIVLDNWKHASGRDVTVWGMNGSRHLLRTLII